VVDPELIRLAQHAAAIEANYKTDEQERIRAVSFALLDCVDYALSQQFIDEDDEELPPELAPILQHVYRFLGDPLC
jgi:hypothetical protein